MGTQPQAQSICLPMGCGDGVWTHSSTPASCTVPAGWGRGADGWVRLDTSTEGWVLAPSPVSKEKKKGCDAVWRIFSTTKPKPRPALAQIPENRNMGLLRRGLQNVRKVLSSSLTSQIKRTVAEKNGRWFLRSHHHHSPWANLCFEVGVEYPPINWRSKTSCLVHCVF